MTARRADLAIGNTTIGTHSNAESGRPFAFLLKGARWIVVGVCPVTGIALWHRVRALCDRRRWWRCSRRRRSSTRHERNRWRWHSHCLDRWRWCNRFHQRRRRNDRWFDLLFRFWRRLFLFRRLFFLNVDDVKFCLHVLNGFICKASDQGIAQKSVKKDNDDNRNQTVRAHSLVVSICHAETTLLLPMLNTASTPRTFLTMRPKPPRIRNVIFCLRFRQALAKPMRAGNPDSAIHRQFIKRAIIRGQFG